MVLLHIQLLADTPEMGRRGRTLGSRELVISGSPYIAVYRIRNAAIEIVRFLHAAQNYPD
jgi:plasmid stabilization system protein ParE